MKIIVVFYRVYNKLGYGFLGKVYKKALMIEFKKEEIPARPQAPIKVNYDDGEIMGEYCADILVEIKATKHFGISKKFPNIGGCLKEGRLPSRVTAKPIRAGVGLGSTIGPRDPMES